MTNIPRVIQALMHPAAFAHAVHSVGLVETHISWVLLTGEYAYKIKKPAKLHFLDFSTLPLRLSACQDELRLNRRFAPELYLGVVPIVGSADAPKMDGVGTPFDYAVKMRQFPAAQQLDLLLASGRLAMRDLEDFGRSLAELHASLPTVPMTADFGDAPQIQEPLSESLRDLEQGAENGELRNALLTIGDWSGLRFAALSSVFGSRKLAGRVRECHGDLHLANLVKLDRGIVPFDCIEFSAGLRNIDVFCDAAFLVMDLVYRGHAELAYAFLNSYIEAGGDYDGLRTLHYYLVYRALVRAKVAMIRAGNAAPEQRDPHKSECADYIQLALSWNRRACPALILMHGFSGSGKTSTSAELMVRLPAIRVRSDVERKRIHGIAPQERSESQLAAGIYTPSANEQVYIRLADIARLILESGEIAVVDASFLQRGERRRFEALAQQLSVPFAIIDCQAPLPEVDRRLAERARQATDASEADLAVLQYQLVHHDPLDASEQVRTLSAQTNSARTFDALIKELRGLLGR